MGGSDLPSLRATSPFFFFFSSSFFKEPSLCHRNGTLTAVFIHFDPAYRQVDWCDIVICKKKYTVDP